MKSLALLTAILLTPALLTADDAHRAKLESLEKKAAEAKAAGREDQLERIHRAIEELRQHQPRKAQNEHAELAESLRAELKQAKKSGREDAAHALEQKLSRIEAAAGDRKKESKKQPGGPAPRERIEHLEQAIKHLHAAGMAEPAERLAQQAAEIRAHLKHPKHPGGDHAKKQPDPHGKNALAEMQQALRHMQEQMQAIQKRVEELAREKH